MLTFIRGTRDEEALQKESFEGFSVIGAGLPRTGTLSTRSALAQLLGGKVYHMNNVGQGTEYDWKFWDHLVDGGKHDRKAWKEFLEGRGFRASLDNPMAIYYKDLMEAFPDAKVLLTVRDPEAWYVSVRDSIYVNNKLSTSPPLYYVMWLLGYSRVLKLIQRSAYVKMTKDQSMFGSVEAGREAAMDFYKEWVADVQAHVPADKLLIFDVREGWEPLCKFLNVPVPDDIEFPRVNDTNYIKSWNKRMKWFGTLITYGTGLVVAAMGCIVYYSV